MTAGRTVRRASPADRPEIAALLDDVFEPVPYRRRTRLWDWRNRDNPAAAPGEGPPDFLVIEGEDGELAGVHGLFPLRVKVGDRTLVAAVDCDFAVAAEARNAGMALKLEAMKADSTELGISTSANDAAERITLALGGCRVPAGRTKFLKPLRASGLLSRKLRSRVGGPAAAAADVIGRAGGLPIDAALRWARAARRRLGSSDPAIETVDRFDDRFDRLWERLRERWTVAVVRNAAYLGWRYGRFPFAGVEAFALVDGGEAAGFAALHHATDHDGLAFAAVLDLFALERAGAEALLTEAVRRADARGAHYLSAKAGAGDLRELLEARGFVGRDSDYCPYTYRCDVPELEPLLGDPGHWYIAQGDGDICFFVEG